MNCKETRKWMSPYLDSELGSTKTFEVSEHLRTCSDCAARFESERRADDLIRDRLSGGAMPNDLWSSVVQDISTPTWVRVLNARRYWALAACFVLVVAGVLVVQPNRYSRHGPVIVERFLAEAPDNRPFAVAEKGMSVAKLDSFLRSTLGVAFSTTSDLMAMGHSRFQVVSAANVKDTLGREYVEVRLNCCGQPILLVLAKPDGGSWPIGLDQVAQASTEVSLQSIDGVNLGVEDLRNVRAAVVSRHSVQHILAALSPVSSG